MMIRTTPFAARDLASWRAIAMVWGPILLITLLHYSTGETLHWLHDVLRRLYYVPIVLAAFAFGVRGSLLASVAASLVYLPHAFFYFTHHDPARGTEKALEILLYNVIALVAGSLADREFAERTKQQETSRKLTELLEETREMERLLVRSGRLEALGELTAGLAHELKNPLASVMGAAEAVIDEVRPDSPRRRMAEILMRELHRLGVILDRFLSFARPGSFDLTRVSLCEAVEGVCELTATRAAQNDVEIRWQRPAEDLTVLGQKEGIAQIVMNLVINAVQAMPGGGVVHLTCARQTRGRRVYGIVAVEDEGPGVPETIREQIFNPFFTTREDGTGLGLAISVRIVDQHHGFIDVGSAAGGGARFEVFLPLAE